eukprot:m.48099 g.48099  ORF g.48099 m.48099 type:complete len:399 (+) comp6017_c0_seq2:196-1392(+)
MLRRDRECLTLPPVSETGAATNLGYIAHRVIDSMAFSPLVCGVVLALVHVAMGQTPCTNTCAGLLSLSSFGGPSVCQMTPCQALCFNNLIALQTSTAIFAYSTLPAANSSTCECETGVGVVVAGVLFSMNMSDGTSAIGSSNGTAINAENNYGCKFSFNVVSGTILDIQSPSTGAIGVLSRESLSPPQCAQNTSCDYLCSVGYSVIQTGDSLNVVSVTPPAWGCNCAVGSGVAASSGTIDFTDGTTAKFNVLDGVIQISTSPAPGLTCQGNFIVAAGTVASLPSTSVFTFGVGSLQNVAPAACKNTSSCDYICSTQYAVTQLGTGMMVTPMNLGSCSCTQGYGIVSNGAAVIVFGNSTRATMSANAGLLSVTAQVEGTTCTAAYFVELGDILSVTQQP